MDQLGWRKRARSLVLDLGHFPLSKGSALLLERAAVHGPTDGPIAVVSAPEYWSEQHSQQLVDFI